MLLIAPTGICRLTIRICVVVTSDPPVPTLSTSVAASTNGSSNSTLFDVVAHFQHAVAGVVLSDFVFSTVPSSAMADVTPLAVVSSAAGKVWTVNVSVTGPSANASLTLIASMAESTGAVVPVNQASAPSQFFLFLGTMGLTGSDLLLRTAGNDKGRR